MQTLSQPVFFERGLLCFPGGREGDKWVTITGSFVTPNGRFLGRNSTLTARG